MNLQEIENLSYTDIIKLYESILEDGTYKNAALYEFHCNDGSIFYRVYGARDWCYGGHFGECWYNTREYPDERYFCGEHGGNEKVCCDIFD